MFNFCLSTAHPPLFYRFMTALLQNSILKETELKLKHFVKSPFYTDTKKDYLIGIK